MIRGRTKSLLRPALWASGLAAVLILAGSADAMTPRLAEPEELAGAWTLDGVPDGACAVTLDLKPVAPNAFALQAPAACLARAGIERAAAWRPSISGLALASSEGATLAVFERRPGGGYAWNGLSLRRAPGSP